MKRPLSEAVYARSCQVIPGGVNSPVRRFPGLGITPLIAKSGKGAIVQDVDGHRYIDLCMSWGALILGHADQRVVAGIREQVENGSSFGIATAVEEELASKIIRLMPSIEKIRFVSSGTEATMTALRLARGFTGRSKIAKFAGHYHGHSDALLVQAGSGASFLNPLATSKGVNSGVIQDTLVLPFNDFDAIASLPSDLAAVIVEPVAGNMGTVPPEPGFLKRLREETQRTGALLIMDEVITGFRVALGGAQALYDIDPDITCLGKVIGGGFPVAALGGKKEIMDHLAPLGEVYQAGTLSGNPVAMRAGIETLAILEQPGFYEALEAATCRFVKPIEEAIQKRGGGAVLQRVGSMMTLFLGTDSVQSKNDLSKCDPEAFKKIFLKLFHQGIYLPPAFQEAMFLSSAHSADQIDYAAGAIADALLDEIA